VSPKELAKLRHRMKLRQHRLLFYRQCIILSILGLWVILYLVLMVYAAVNHNINAAFVVLMLSILGVTFSWIISQE
jgi:hypothetical protein